MGDQFSLVFGVSFLFILFLSLFSICCCCCVVVVVVLWFYCFYLFSHLILFISLQILLEKKIMTDFALSLTPKPTVFFVAFQSFLSVLWKTSSLFFFLFSFFFFFLSFSPSSGSLPFLFPLSFLPFFLLPFSKEQNGFQKLSSTAKAPLVFLLAPNAI